ncbi:MAG TPA: hypothetical protein PKN02_10780 [Thermotogota bacterium]|nr:hypothetical protein [Thermotogota bacterium]
MYLYLLDAIRSIDSLDIRVQVSMILQQVHLSPLTDYRIEYTV